MLSIVHCAFEKGSQNQYFQSNLLVGMKVITQKSTLYALDNVHNSGRLL